MTLDKALEILELYIPDPESVAVTDSIPAIQLGLEALRLVRAIRHAHPQFKAWELLGETEK